MSEIYIGIAMLVIGGALGWVAKRFSIKTKVQVEVDSLKIRTEKLEEDKEKTQPLIFKSLLAILLALKRGKMNGEGDEALEALNDYFVNNTGR